MPQTKVHFYQEEDRTVPFLDWLDGLSEKAQDKCRLKIERLQSLGHELRRPEADYLRDGIYELRVRLRTINYRMLYFFHGNTVAVLSHGVIKGRTVPAAAIEEAIERKRKFMDHPERHTYREQ